MSLEKGIEHGKEHRKIYRGAKAVDCTCRNHGSCDFCKMNRLRQANREEERTKQEVKEWEEF